MYNIHYTQYLIHFNYVINIMDIRNVFRNVFINIYMYSQVYEYMLPTLVNYMYNIEYRGYGVCW